MWYRVHVYTNYNTEQCQENAPPKFETIRITCIIKIIIYYFPVINNSVIAVG